MQPWIIILLLMVAALTKPLVYSQKDPFSIHHNESSTNFTTYWQNPPLSNDSNYKILTSTKSSFATTTQPTKAEKKKSRPQRRYKHRFEGGRGNLIIEGGAKPPQKMHKKSIDRPMIGAIVIACFFSFVTLSLTIAVLIFCRKKNTVFVFQKTEQEDFNNDVSLGDSFFETDDEGMSSRASSVSNIRKATEKKLSFSLWQKLKKPQNETEINRKEQYGMTGSKSWSGNLTTESFQKSILKDSMPKQPAHSTTPMNFQYPLLAHCSDFVQQHMDNTDHPSNSKLNTQASAWSSRPWHNPKFKDDTDESTHLNTADNETLSRSTIIRVMIDTINETRDIRVATDFYRTQRGDPESSLSNIDHAAHQSDESSALINTDREAQQPQTSETLSLCCNNSSSLLASIPFIEYELEEKEKCALTEQVIEEIDETVDSDLEGETKCP